MNYLIKYGKNSLKTGCQLVVLLLPLTHRKNVPGEPPQCSVLCGVPGRSVSKACSCPGAGLWGGARPHPTPCDRAAQGTRSAEAELSAVQGQRRAFQKIRSVAEGVRGG